ncbi:MAG: alpha/beta hydrolase [Mycolicibacterium sp.]|nr:alpha/beta hydrolase [Mycolicibacterium sp.]
MTTSDGVALSVREYGTDRADHTVVLLHGLCLSKASWDLQIAELMRRWRDNLRIIAYDHRGHGDSADAPMHTYHVDRLADDLADVLAALDVTSPVTLVGHSMGGMTALTYLRRTGTDGGIEPHAVVLVVAAAGKLTTRGLGRLLATPALDIVHGLVQHGPTAATDSAVRALTRPLCAALLKYGVYRHPVREALITLAAGTINATPLTTKVGFLRGLKHYDQYQNLGDVTVKTVIIGGGADTLIPPAHARDLAAGIPGATLIHQTTAGHMLLHETPKVVSEAIADAITDSRPVSIDRQAVGAASMPYSQQAPVGGRVVRCSGPIAMDDPVGAQRQETTSWGWWQS